MTGKNVISKMLLPVLYLLYSFVIYVIVSKNRNEYCQDKSLLERFKLFMKFVTIQWLYEINAPMSPILFVIPIERLLDPPQMGWESLIYITGIS